MQTWYPLKIAGSRDEYLRGLGVAEDVIAFVNAAPANIQQQLVNEARKNPQIAVPQLQQIQQQTPAPVDPYSPFERRMGDWASKQHGVQARSQVPGIGNWVMVEMKRHRLNPMAGCPSNRLESASFEFYRMPQGLDYVGGFGEFMSRMADWISATGAQISSYTFETANQAQAEWHEQRAKQGEGTSYEEKNVVYGPEWKGGREWQGWTVQEVRSANDLDCEGNKMDHCVGSYADQVGRGSSRIFSLRDPHNEPHVTIETDSDGKHVNQVQGKSNTDPKPQYTAMVKEWVQSGGGPETYQEDYGGDLLDAIENNSDVQETLATWLLEENKFGLKIYGRELPPAQKTYDKIMEQLTHGGRHNEYRSSDRRVAETMAKLYMESKDPADQADFAKFIETEQDRLWRHLSDYAHTGVEGSYPDEGDYDEPEEYERALEAYQKKEEEWMDYYWVHEMPYAFVHDMTSVFYSSQNQQAGTVQAEPDAMPPVPAVA